MKTIDHAEAEALFNRKLPLLRRVVNYRCSRKRLLSFEDDILQLCCLHLWQQCLRAASPGIDPFEISCELIFVSGFSAWARQRHHERAIQCLTDLGEFTEENPAPEPIAREVGITIDGVWLTLADAHIDAAESIETIENGTDALEVARRRGISRERVRQLRKRLGGVGVPNGKTTRWYYPAEAGLTAP